MSAVLFVGVLTGGSAGAAAEPLAVTSASPSTDPADVYGVGGGQSNLGTQNFNLSAHTGPNGDFGHWGVRVTNAVTGALIVDYRVDVSCVNIHAIKRGVIKGEVIKVTPTPNTLGVTLGETIILGIEDAGEPSDAPALVDDFFTPHMDVFPGLSCKFITYIGNFNNVNQGNITVKEA